MLSFLFGRAEEDHEVAKVEAQTEKSHEAGTIWNAIREADVEAVQSIVESLHGDYSRLIDDRGPVGDTVLHLCFLYNSDRHKEIAHWLIDRCPELLLTQYTGPLYYGENCLHIAIVNRDWRSIRYLVSRAPALLHQRATGDFFRRSNFLEKGGGTCYYGELPLLFAACTNQPDVVRFFVEECAADLYATDSHGNTVLHLMVVHNLPEMYDVCEALWVSHVRDRVDIRRGRDELRLVRNREGLTPLTLAASLGRRAVFTHLLEKQREVQWKYGPITCVVYPLEELDGIVVTEDGGVASLEDARESSRGKGAHESEAEAEEEVVDGASVGSDATHGSDSPRASASASKGRARSNSAAADGGVGELATAMSSALSTTSSASSGKTAVARINEMKSALEHIIDNEQVDLLMLPRVIELLNYKWDRFASRIFFRRFTFYLVYLSIFTATVVLQSLPLDPSCLPSSLPNAHPNATVPADPGHTQPQCAPPGWLLRDPASCVRSLQCALTVVGEFVVLYGAISKGILETREMRKNGLRAYLSVTGASFLENVLSSSFSASIVLAATSSWASVLKPGVFHHFSRAMVSLASVLGWSYVLWFLLGFRLTGPFVIMIYKMLVSDILRFFVLLSVFMMGFSQAFFVLSNKPGGAAFAAHVMDAFKTMLGDIEFDNKNDDNPLITTVLIMLLMTYVIVVSIMLLNLLIAMMGNTYSEVNEKAEQQWHMERARIIRSIESELSPDDRFSERNRYWTVIRGKAFLQLEESDPDAYLFQSASGSSAAGSALADESAPVTAVGSEAETGRSHASVHDLDDHDDLRPPTIVDPEPLFDDEAGDDHRRRGRTAHGGAVHASNGSSSSSSTSSEAGASRQPASARRTRRTGGLSLATAHKRERERSHVGDADGTSDEDTAPAHDDNDAPTGRVRFQAMTPPSTVRSRSRRATATSGATASSLDEEEDVERSVRSTRSVRQRTAPRGASLA